MKAPQVGCTYVAKWECDEENPLRFAKVLKMRRGKGGVKRLRGGGVVEVEHRERDCYVHYCGFDRRLDEWIPASALDTSEGDLSHLLAPAKRARGKGKCGDAADRPGEDDASDSEGPRRGRKDPCSVKNLERVYIGRHCLEPWYYSPYPEWFTRDGELHICDTCLEFNKTAGAAAQHRLICTSRCPPGGVEIFRESTIGSGIRFADKIAYREETLEVPPSQRTASVSVFKVDGAESPRFCANLCLLSKLFLDQKTQYYDTARYVFYVLTLNDANGARVAGYFSRERGAAATCNVACILVLPHYQGLGLGTLLVSVSYAISRLQGTTGAPERPLSDYGLAMYANYWRKALLRQLRRSGDGATLGDVSRETGIELEDLVRVLPDLRCARGTEAKGGIAEVVVDAEALERLCADTDSAWFANGIDARAAPGAALEAA